MELRSSQTSVNLMRAFAGESQAANRYLFAAEQAKKENLSVIEAVSSSLQSRREHMLKFSMTF